MFIAIVFYPSETVTNYYGPSFAVSALFYPHCECLKCLQMSLMRLIKQLAQELETRKIGKRLNHFVSYEESKQWLVKLF